MSELRAANLVLAGSCLALLGAMTAMAAACREVAVVVWPTLGDLGKAVVASGGVVIAGGLLAGFAVSVCKGKGDGM